MDSGTLDMLHDTRDENVGSIAHGIDLNLLTLQVFINKDRMILCNSVDDSDELLDLLIVEGDLHTLSTKYVRRTNKYRIAETVGNFLCLLSGKYSSTCSSRDMGLLKNLIKKLTILGSIDILCLGTKNLNAHLH